MARRHAGVKALRVTKRRTIRNEGVKRQVRKAVSVVRKAVTAGKADEAKTALTKAFSQLDRAAKGGVMHKRTVARLKSRLSSAVAKLGKKK